MWIVEPPDAADADVLSYQRPSPPMTLRFFIETNVSAVKFPHLQASAMISFFKNIILFSLLTLVAMGTPAYAAAGGPHEYWTNPSGAGVWNLDQYITISSDQPTNFWSHEFYLQGGDTGYIGLQDTPNGKTAIFSLWNATAGSATSSGFNCQSGTEGGPVWRCMGNYSWKAGVRYRLRLWETASTPNGVTWVGTVQDTSTGIETVIGYLTSRSGQNLISYSVNWIENYSLNGSANPGVLCNSMQPATGYFEYPTANSGAITFKPNYPSNGVCGSHNSGENNAIFIYQ